MFLSVLPLGSGSLNRNLRVVQPGQCLLEIANICSPRLLKRMFNRPFSYLLNGCSGLHIARATAWPAIITCIDQTFFFAAFYGDKSYRKPPNGVRTKRGSARQHVIYTPLNANRHATCYMSLNVGFGPVRTCRPSIDHGGSSDPPGA